MIKAILFDLDNTLIDFMKMKKLSCEAAIDSMIDAGLHVKKDAALKILFELYDEHGMEDPKIFQKFLIKVIGKVDYRILAYGVVAYRKMRTGFLEPYPHTQYTLLQLKGKGLKLGIVTDAPRLKAWLRLASMKIADFFDVVVTYEDTGRLKPHRLPFMAALKKLNVQPEECLMVGDMPQRDIKGAQELGIKTCFARYGNTRGQETEADIVLDDIKDILYKV
ncbi:MAG TPA: TIGR02253 family HAD-type hydrolase [Candidatus Nanoarchaeia archaeon]|nr:TIGR02253 family HAD-type hydrolase [Candidatus Nanoarchaeia archaeon]